MRPAGWNGRLGAACTGPTVVKLCRESIYSDGDSILGILLRGSKLICFTLEDEHRDVKVPGENHTPTRIHRVGPRDTGGLTCKHKARTPDVHREMLWLRDVSGLR